MRIGIFSDSLNLPPKEGINVHTYNVARSLANQPDTEVLLVVYDRGWLNLDILGEQPFDTLVIPSTDFYDHEKIAKIINEYSLDVLQTYMVYFAAVVLGKASYETQKPMAVEFHDLEKTIAPIYLSDKTEIAFHDKLQRQAASLASLVRIMSAYDFDYVTKTWPEVAKVAAWMPVNINNPGVTVTRSSAKANHVLFIGNTSYPPNNDAASFIESKLAPALPNITFSLVGRRTERFKGPNVQAHGMVDNIKDFLETHPVGLAPIFEGSGMKIKLLDYLSAGLVVLTTPLGAHGYPASDAIIIEEDVQKWPALLEELLRDENELERRGKTAKQLFLEHFDLDRNIKKLAKAYKELQYAPVKLPADFDELAVDQSKIYWLKEIRETPRPPLTEQRYFKGRA